ncbi:MAG: GNAT family N-acetyltransferase [Betaproteobacteria bacterium]
MPLDGPIAEGQFVALGWPERDEYDLITALRNRPVVRACFLDSRTLDLAANREWIAHGMKRPHEGLLSVRLGPQHVFCGTIGWSGYEPEKRTFDIGRLVIDAAMVRPYRVSFPAGYPGVALDASRALLRFAFERMGLEYVTSFFLADRALPRRINVLCGGRNTGDVERVRPDGSRVRVCCMSFSRADWFSTQSQTGARSATAELQP